MQKDRSWRKNNLKGVFGLLFNSFIMEFNELKEQAQELIDFGNASEKVEGYGMLKALKFVENNYTHNSRCVSWSVKDFEGRAEEIWLGYTKKSKFYDTPPKFPYARKWQHVFDSSKFEEALFTMIRKHDASLGISWDTIDFYLDDMCLRKIS